MYICPPIFFSNLENLYGKIKLNKLYIKRVTFLLFHKKKIKEICYVRNIFTSGKLLLDVI